MDEDVGSGVLGEIRARLAAAADAAQARGESLLPPLLILGTSERVGSNWVSDTLRPVLGQHNEPFRQQLGPDHPWSALNPCFAGTSHAAICSLGRHWLVSFAVAKYGPVRQAVKETNLFFALPTLLAVLPGAPVLVLSRSPLGVASSFMRGDLFRRWGYRSRYQQMIAMTRHGDSSARRLAVLVPDDDPADLVALVRLHVLNTVLLADALDGRGFAHIAYETAVTRPGDAHERGGRLHLNPATGSWTVSEGYQDHPAYWVTWIGAAAFAAWNGARLPGRAELIQLTQDAPMTGNAGYRSGDVTPATESGRSASAIHHLLGNLQVWCSDGPDRLAGGPAVRWLHGIAWNTPATQDAAQQPRHRHILGCSRGVGIRLVRDGTQRPFRIDELATRLNAWIGSLADRSRPLTQIDDRLIRALDASQADAGLVAHVAAGTREPGHG